jgi:iodotyrosine deiodinase
MEKKYPFLRFEPLLLSPEEMEKRAQGFYLLMNQRRSVRHFSDKPVPRVLIETLILTASTAPSGAHKQPWTFCLVGDPDIKREIRIAAEEEEKESYERRMNQEWLEALAPLGTVWQKPFLETAPWIVVAFKKSYDVIGDAKKKNYYSTESIGLACGLFLAAVQNAGLVSLTHTPSPMDFLCRILNRPENERPFLLIPVGYAASDAEVPDLKRKSLDEICEVFE